MASAQATPCRRSHRNMPAAGGVQLARPPRCSCGTGFGCDRACMSQAACQDPAGSSTISMPRAVICNTAQPILTWPGRFSGPCLIALGESWTVHMPPKAQLAVVPAPARLLRGRHTRLHAGKEATGPAGAAAHLRRRLQGGCARGVLLLHRPHVRLKARLAPVAQ